MSHSYNKSNTSYKKKKFTSKYVPDFPNTEDHITRAMGSSASDNTFEKKDLMMAAVKDIQIPNTELTFKRAMIYRKNKNGKVGRLLILGDKYFSTGLRENKDKEIVNGYSLPMFLYDRDGPTEYQQAFVKMIELVELSINEWLLANAKEIGRPDLLKVSDPHDSRLSSILSWQIDAETGERQEEKGPSLWAQLKTFYDRETKQLENSSKLFKMGSSREQYTPEELLGSYLTVRPLIWVRSVAVRRDRINVQVKIWELSAYIRVNDGPTRLIPLDDLPDESKTGGFESDAAWVARMGDPHMNEDDEYSTAPPRDQLTAQEAEWENSEEDEPEPVEEKSTTVRRRAAPARRR